MVNACFLTLIITLNVFIITSSNPIVTSNFDFVDDWDYLTIPNEDPILNAAAKSHDLPPKSNRQAKEGPSSLQLFRLIDESSKLGNAIVERGDSIRNIIPCSACILGITLLQASAQKNESFEIAKEKFVALCVSLKIQNELVCSGVFDVFGPDVLAVLYATPIGPAQICRMLQGESCSDVENSLHDWDIVLSEVPKPKVENAPLPEYGNPTLKVLHLSDPHYDPEYLEGSIANCDDPLCCRSFSSPPKDNGVVLPAGRWGAYDTCDVPKILIEHMLATIAKQHPDIDYIIWTGDLPPHDIWNQTKNSSLEIIRDSVQQMKTAFPNIPILPAIGNHESIPCGNFVPHWNKDKRYSMDWLYEETYKQWKQWLPKSEENSILHGAFYSALIRPGLRLISINTNYCYEMSWWLYVNSTDPATELKWLAHQLQAAENKGEKVHIIGHAPPGGTDCLKTWSRNYYKIVERYENTITAQFFGHTHADEFEVFYDTKNHTIPTNVAYIGPSITPFSGHNPAYRIYYIDGEHKGSTWEVIDHETWIMDLDKANTEVEESPELFKLYSARDSYNMTNLRPTEWNKLIYRMAKDTNLFESFYRFYYRNSPMRPSYTDKEKLQILCDLKSGKSHERGMLCDDLEVMFST